MAESKKKKKGEILVKRGGLPDSSPNLMILFLGDLITKCWSFLKLDAAKNNYAF